MVHPALRLLILCALVACGDRRIPLEETDPVELDAPILRDIDELQRIRHQPRSCDTHADCPAGSHCDATTERCDWTCLADSDCGEDARCTAHGACVDGARAFVPYSANDTAACQAIPAAERRAELLALNTSSRSCGSNDECPCGSYCTNDAECRVDCLADDPPPELTCAETMTCTALGQCQATDVPPIPPVAITPSIMPALLGADVRDGPSVVSVDVRITTANLAIIDGATSAQVMLSIGERDGQAPGPFPRVRCTADAPLTDTCTLGNGWVFDLASGSVTSHPRTVWIELPQVATPTSWTLEARSAWAIDAATATMIGRSRPVPTSDAGRYAGTIAWPAGSGTTLPVEVVVTATHVALIEPTRVLLPAGQVVLPRDPALATRVSWLESDSTGQPPLVVRLDHVDIASNPAAGTFEAKLELRTHAGLSAHAIALTRADGPDPVACTTTCDGEAHCDPTLGRCLPGTAATPGTIVADADAIPTATLRAAQLESWLVPARTARGLLPDMLAGSGIVGIERPYCYRAQQPTPGRLGTNISPISGDLECAGGSQRMFSFAERTTGWQPGINGGNDFDLLEACLTDLGAQPTPPATPANLLADRPCASLARFVLALDANTGTSLGAAGQRLVMQVLRHWLGAHAYVARTAVFSQQYDDALATPANTTSTRLATIVDTAERGFRMLLDERVRTQFATGPELARAVTAPDHHLAGRPSARWSFNTTETTVPDVEGTNAMLVSNVDLSTQRLLTTGAANSSCQTAAPVRVDERSFAITGHLAFNPRGKLALIEKVAPGGDRFTIEASELPSRNVAGDDPGIVPSGVRIEFRDSRGASAVFEIAPWQGSGFYAFSMDGDTPRLSFRGDAAQTAIELAPVARVGALRWGAPGTVQLACAAPKVCTRPKSCARWDRNLPGDGAGVTTLAPWTEVTGSLTRTCTTVCTPRCTTRCNAADPAVSCPLLTSNRRTNLVNALPVGAPATAIAAFTAAASHALVDSGSDNTDPGTTTTWWTWNCAGTFASYPQPDTGPKPTCGCLEPYAFSSSGVAYDELAVWPRPFAPGDLDALATRYAKTPASSSVAPYVPEAVAADPGIAANLVEAASATYEALAAYVEAERAGIYGECQSGTQDARTRTFTRAGRVARVLALIEGEARMLAALPGGDTAPWRPRYDAALVGLLAKRTLLTQALARATTCANPIGIEDDTLPLVQGELDVTPAARFFASSRLFATKAREAIALAESELGPARSAYLAQRASQFQITLGADAAAQRMAALRLQYETQLRRYCGTPPSGQDLLPQFLAGTLDPGSCFIKTEVPGCASAGASSIVALDPTCVRGELGEQVIAIRAAALDSTAAVNAEQRAVDAFDARNEHCARRQHHFEQDELILSKHNEALKRMRTKQRRASLISGIISFAGSIATSTAARGNDGGGGGGGGGGSSAGTAAAVFAVVLGIMGQGAADTERAMADEEQAAVEAYNALAARRSHQLDLLACYHEADNAKFAIDAAHDVVKRSYHDGVAALHALDDATNQLRGLAQQATGELAVEANLIRTPPHHHYWLDQHIEDFRRYMVRARRLTFLALRAHEAESQLSLGRRGQVLSARLPSQLLETVLAIEDHSQPLQGTAGLVVGEVPITLSLRDEILRIPDLANVVNPPPGYPRLSPEQAFSRYLASDSSKMYNAAGTYLGRGFRFVIRPSGWSEFSCAERIWRVTTSISMGTPVGGTPNNIRLLLQQRNAFGSQVCRAPATAPLRIERVQPARNLLAGDDSFSATSPFLAMTTTGHRLTREELEARAFEQGEHAGFAGRGVYGEYLLIFPSQTFTPAVLAAVKDVLLRFDLVELTDEP